MTIRDTMGNPVEKLVEEVRLWVTGSYPIIDFRTDKICGMFEFGGIIHVPDITCPECPAGNDAEKTGKAGIVVEWFLRNIRI